MKSVEGRRVELDGIRYHRLQQRMTQTELAARAGLERRAILQVENQTGANRTAGFYLAVSRALDVPIEELRKQDCDEADLPDSIPRSSAKYAATNCIAVYRRKHRLTFVELGRMLGVSKQRAHVICGSLEASPRYVEILARQEGINAADFCILYAHEGEAA
jgi:Predicted transcriptional regulators